MPPLPGGATAPDEKPALPGGGAVPPEDKPALPGSGVTPPSAAVDPMVEARRDVNGLLSSARELRGLGNTQDALELLQHADLVAPNHPAVLAETAEVYEQMGLNTKAVDTWRSIQLQGEAKAGQYCELAVRRLGSVPGAATTAPSFANAPVDDSKRMRLGACKIERQFEGVGGERFTLRVPLQRAGNRSINPNAIDMKVFFYYRQNGSVALDNVTPLTETWQTEPVDWNGAGEEIVDVVYHLPPATAAEITQRSQKSYHGYMLHLYYDNKLQDVAAEPRDLLDAAMASRGLPAGDVPNPLLPPVGR
jgi:hypothetical protein